MTEESVLHSRPSDNLLKEGAAVILASHMGRPKGERNPELSLRPAAERLSELLDQPVQFADDCIGSETAAMKKRFSRDRCCFLKIFVSIKKKKRMIPICKSAGGRLYSSCK